MSETTEPTGVSIHTGFPNPAADTSLRGLDLHKLLVRHAASTYLFRVRGNQWEDSGVRDGDIAIVDRALDPQRNDVVLWWDDARGEFAMTTPHNMPANASCWGVVTSSIHEFRQMPDRPAGPTQ